MMCSVPGRKCFHPMGWWQLWARWVCTEIVGHWIINQSPLSKDSPVSVSYPESHHAKFSGFPDLFSKSQLSQCWLLYTTALQACHELEI